MKETELFGAIKLWGLIEKIDPTFLAFNEIQKQWRKMSKIKREDTKKQRQWEKYGITLHIGDK